jgi:hypothetical protein
MDVLWDCFTLQTPQQILTAVETSSVTDVNECRRLRSPSPSLIQLRMETENCARGESDKVIK